MRVVLASGSPRREELLSALTSDFAVITSDVPEPLTDDAVADAVTLARAKALAVAATVSDAVVIGADTVVYDDLRLYGKPVDTDDAVAMLARLQGRTHHVATGIAVAARGEVHAGVSISEVTLNHLSYDTITRYVASGRPLDKAGAYAIQDEDIPTVSELHGCYCGVMGLPLWLLREELRRIGSSAALPSATYLRCAACPERPAAPA